MAEIPQNLAHAILLFGLIFVMIGAGVYAVKKFRGQLDQRASLTSDMTTTFRQLHGRGDLSDDEYRTIKTMLDNEIRKDSSETGKTG